MKSMKDMKANSSCSSWFKNEFINTKLAQVISCAFLNVGAFFVDSGLDQVECLNSYPFGGNIN